MAAQTVSIDAARLGTSAWCFTVARLPWPCSAFLAVLRDNGQDEYGGGSGEEVPQEETGAARDEREVDSMRCKGEALATVRAELGDYLWHPLADFCFFESAAVRRRRASRARDAERLTQATLDHTLRARAEAVYLAVAGPLTDGGGCMSLVLQNRLAAAHRILLRPRRGLCSRTEQCHRGGDSFMRGT